MQKFINSIKSINHQLNHRKEKKYKMDSMIVEHNFSD